MKENFLTCCSYRVYFEFLPSVDHDGIATG